MPTEDSPGKRAAKNAMALTIRMVITTVIGLYTSRVVLEALGVEDYGIYGVIGGVIAIASFVNKAMASASSRFITVELGKKNETKLKSIFNASFHLHLWISGLVIIFGETIGVWFVNTQMVFPPDRMFAVNVLYQFTIFNTIVSFTQIPYNADIIAHERMKIFAYIELLNAGLKLGIVFMLFLFKTDLLIIYGALSFSVSIIIALIYRFYCIKHFKEARISLKFDHKIARSMISFSSFNLYSSFGVLVNAQGKPIVLNMFFGVIANAASSIALTVVGAVEGLSTTITQAFNPQIIKQYSAGDYELMQTTMRRAVQMTLWVFGLIAIPVIITAPSILYLWLGQVPEYSVLFLRLIMVTTLIKVYSNLTYTLQSATGKIKKYALVAGTLYILCPLVSYVLLLKFKDPSLVYIVEIGIFVIVSVIATFIIHQVAPQLKLANFIFGALKGYFSIALGFIIVYLLCMQSSPIDYINQSVAQTISDIVITTLISTAVLSILFPLIAFNRGEILFITAKLRYIFIRIVRLNVL